MDNKYRLFKGFVAVVLAVLAVVLFINAPRLRVIADQRAQREAATGTPESSDGVASLDAIAREQQAAVGRDSSQSDSAELPPIVAVKADSSTQTQGTLQLPAVGSGLANSVGVTGTAAGGALATDVLLPNGFDAIDMNEPMERDPIGIQVMPPDYEIPEQLPAEGRGADSPRGAGTLNLNPPPVIYGVNFISSAEEPADPQRYNNGKATGATWNRFPFYWHLIEESHDNFNYSRHDALMTTEVANGLIDNAILMGIPGFYFTDGRAVPSSLNQPIFSDGTDIPGPGKTINNNNKWARYVFTTVNRYKPGGVFAQQKGWNGLQGIRQWELWNEPDLPWFWDGTKQEYARLLKVGYFAVKQADPQAQVIFGAVANNFDDINYYGDVLEILKNDTAQPRAQDHGYFHDILATHSYYYPWQTWYHVFRAKNTQGKYGLDGHGVWLNETGMSAWDDYPGPVWDSGSWYRGTMAEQAGYTIQTIMYAVYAGADAVFHFQLYDACGNQPQGNDLPPHNGNLCTSDGKYIHNTNFFCSGDANGLYRNARDAICFKQHPNPETPRANFEAFKTMTQYFQDVVPLKRHSVCTHGADDGQEWIAFYRPNTNQRIMGLWSCDNRTRTAAIPAVDTGALLISADGTKRFIAPSGDGKYYLTLPGTTNQNYPNPNGSFWPVPGSPFILIERDLEKPYAEIYADKKANGNIAVGWFGDDGMGSGIANFDIKVSVDGGPQQNWLNRVTTTVQEWSGSYQYGVEFTIIGRDYGGNTSPARSVLIGQRPPTNPTPTATTPPTATPTPAGTPTPGPSPTPSATPTPALSATPDPLADEPTITVMIDPETAFVGDLVTYQIRIANPNDRAISNVTMLNTLPWQMEYLEGSAWVSVGEDEPTIAGDKLTWNGTIEPDTTVTIGFRATVVESNPALSNADNEVAVSYPGGETITERQRSKVIDADQLTTKMYLPIMATSP